jgi:adenylate cyclase
MTEEITSALAMVHDLKVVARTSAFQFKGEKNDMRAVGKALNATHLVEGSVRKVGDRVRITAQLIEVGQGTHLWSENYDRELTDVFLIQDDIAQAIATALRLPLGLPQRDTVVMHRTIDPESYQHFLRAKALVRARGLKGLTEGASLLEQVVVRNPDHAPAWALLALANHLRPNSSPERTAGPVEGYRKIVNSSLSKAEAAARRAVTLEPNLADGYVVLAHVQGVQGNILQSLQLAQSKALVLDPNNSEALHGYALGLAIVGHVKEAIAMRLRLLELEPGVLNFITRAAVVLWLDGQNDAAIAMLKDLAPERNHTLAMIYASMGRYNEAIDVLERLPSGNYPRETIKDAVRLLRTAPAKAPSPQTLPALGNLSFVYLYVGAPDRVFEVYDRGIEGGYMAGAGYPESLWHPSYSALRKTERFKAYAKKAGLVEYWRARGWPEFCRPTGPDDFVCV